MAIVWVGSTNQGCTRLQRLARWMARQVGGTCPAPGSSLPGAWRGGWLGW